MVCQYTTEKRRWSRMVLLPTSALPRALRATIEACRARPMPAGVTGPIPVILTRRRIMRPPPPGTRVRYVLANAPFVLR